MPRSTQPASTAVNLFGPNATRKHYRIHSLTVTALVDVKTLYAYDVHCTTTKKRDAKSGRRSRATTPRTCGRWLLTEPTTASHSATIFGRNGFVHLFFPEPIRRSIKRTTPG